MILEDLSQSIQITKGYYHSVLIWHCVIMMSYITLFLYIMHPCYPDILLRWHDSQKSFYGCMHVCNFLGLSIINRWNQNTVVTEYLWYQYSFPEFVYRHHMLHEREAILSKLQANRYSYVIFDTLKSTVLRYFITWADLIYLSLRSIPIWQISNIPNFQLDKSMSDTLKR